MYKFFCSGKECDFEMWSHKVEANVKCFCGYLADHEDPHEMKKTVKKSRSRKSSTCDKSNRGSISQITSHRKAQVKTGALQNEYPHIISHEKDSEQDEQTS